MAYGGIEGSMHFTVGPEYRYRVDMAPVLRRSVLAALPAMVLFGLREAAAGPVKIILGSASEGGGFVLYGGALVDALRSVDPSIEVHEQATRGTLDNVPMLERGELDLGFSSGEVVHELFAGVDRPVTRLKVVSVMYPTPGMFAVRADSRYRNIRDLEGRPVVWNSRGSGLAVQGRYIMEGLGLDPDGFFQPIYTDRLSDGPAMVLDERASALWGGGLRWPGFVTIANSSRGARFVVPTAEEADRILARHGFLRRFTVPAGLYPGQYEPIESVGSWSYVLARADLAEAVGYRLAVALRRIERGALAARQLAQSTAKNTLAALPSLNALHPGVARYYREIGLIP